MTAVQTTRDELSLIKSYLMLTHILKVFENDAKMLKSDEPMQTSPLYTEMIRGASQCAAVLLSGIRREFKKRNIRICEVNRGEAGVDADYLCRGLHGTLHLDREPFDREADLRMRAYMGLEVAPVVTDGGRQSAPPARNYGQRASSVPVGKTPSVRSYSPGAYA
ncbi:hypothetical protein QWJ34_14000 [Saccharibacillus sp. CPCC 101409]|uniref:hypothetical protein n=1 Tax=Saccharibacillus sp. CPCC 101409 TaxID=3058041 RepID=UPI0026731DA3|nr:hypothetical protein [Saccharibacillus sp. CPCC 101409]MDO3410880.1 hypothetical protein [Saccharibacillus sp. CPCC 101409]